MASRTAPKSGLRFLSVHIHELDHSGALGVVLFFRKETPPHRSPATDWEPWRERPLNRAWDGFITPRRGRSRHGSFPVNRNRWSGRHKTPPDFRDAPQTVSRYGCKASSNSEMLRDDGGRGDHDVRCRLHAGAEVVRGLCPPSRPVLGPLLGPSESDVTTSRD